MSSSGQTQTGSQPLLTPDEVASLLQISRKSVYRLAAQTLPAIRIGGLLRFRPADLVAYIERQRPDLPLEAGDEATTERAGGSGCCSSTKCQRRSWDATS